MTRLPVPGQDSGAWGSILNDFLSIEHNADGSLKGSGSLATKANDSGVVHNTGNETIAGTKTFSSAPIVPSSSFPEAAITSLVGDLAAKVAASTATTKGDLLAATAASTITRLGVGGNGQKLVADPNQTTGIKWATDAYLRAADYGATFDGSTDDATALQAAITAAISANKPLVLEPGTAIVGTSLSIGSPITIVGAGREATTLKAKNTLNNYVISFTGGSAGVGIIGAHLSDFTIDGNSANVTAGGGIKADGAVQCSFERMHLTSCYDWGIKLGPITGGAFGHHNRVVGCLFDQGGNSAGFGGGVWTTSSDENWFYGSDFEFLGGSSNPVGANPIMLYDQAGLQHVTATNFVAGLHNCIGIRVQNAKDTKMVGCTFDGLAGDSIFISGTRCVVVGNLFTSPGDNGSVASSGVHLEFNTHFNVVSGNVLETSNNAGKTRSLIREESTGGSGDNLILGNTLSQNAAPTVALLESAGAATTILRDNVGWATESNGTATVANGTTSVAVSHGLAVTPALANISVTPTNNLGSAAKFWISGVGATQFTVNVDVNPGATTATFAWSARM
ncbi:MAG TPA: glycosyl hydrolase family 28-related protein [Candidatus Saccharimonadales bacterium]|jgi:hypothetical protein|nr:glycosyl hydrolase family 28-related protein [Candidatus Saccharimonadales bacterium]